MPLIADGSIVDLSFVKVEEKPTKTPGVEMLSLDMVTTGPSKAQDGADLGAGIHVFHNLVLSPSGKGTWDMVARNIASVTQAAGVTTTYGDLVANPVAVLQGQNVRAKIRVVPEGVTKEGKAFRAKNEVSVFMKVS
jgi:hypothetical protein